MLTRLQFEAYLLSIKAPLSRPYQNQTAICRQSKYYLSGTSWSDFATTIANSILKNLPMQELNGFISGYYFDMDDPYDFYRAAIQSGLPLRLMSSIIHTKAHLC